MTPSPGSRPRAEVAPPRESTGKLQRTGYIALAASGLVLATAFGAVAQVMGGTSDSPDAVDRTASQSTGNSGGNGGPELVPGQAIPGQTQIMVDGVAVTGTLPPATTSPTTVVSVGPDGMTTTTVITPTRSSSSNTRPGTPPPGGSDSELPPTTRPTTDAPDPTTPPTTTPPPSTSDPGTTPPDSTTPPDDSSPSDPESTSGTGSSSASS
ncbi:hypothetical protein [Prauserella flavalba]|uniref:Uncharacterized protein n=1 Tax=Prauserella flavalba TaxID=1477506 RepID=A0A318LDY0_9PSEU|nr:hypothetical protein [Prauserella flavalba]PXY24224.1 hypothetical protein BA062_28770 [Prauserella flavalba]